MRLVEHGSEVEETASSGPLRNRNSKLHLGNGIKTIFCHHGQKAKSMCAIDVTEIHVFFNRYDTQSELFINLRSESRKT